MITANWCYNMIYWSNVEINQLIISAKFIFIYVENSNRNLEDKTIFLTAWVNLNVWNFFTAWLNLVNFSPAIFVLHSLPAQVLFNDYVLMHFFNSFSTLMLCLGSRQSTKFITFFCISLNWIKLFNYNDIYRSKNYQTFKS